MLIFHSGNLFNAKFRQFLNDKSKTSLDFISISFLSVVFSFFFLSDSFIFCRNILQTLKIGSKLLPSLGGQVAFAQTSFISFASRMCSHPCFTRVLHA